MLRDHCRWRATNLHGYMDDWALDPALLQRSVISPFTCPLASILLSRLFQGMVFIAAFWYFSAAISASLMFPQYGTTTSKIFRIRLDANSEKYEIGGAITLLRFGCSFATYNFSLGPDNFFNIFPRSQPTSPPVSVDGFFVQASSSLRGGSNYSLPFIIIEGSDDDETSWRLAGRTTHHRYGRFGIRFLPQPRGADELARGAAFDYRPPWPIFAAGALELFSLTALLLVPALLAAAGRSAHAKRALIATSLALSLLLSVAAVGFLLLALPREALGPATRGLLYLAAATLLAGPEPRLFAALPALALGGLLARVLEDCAAFPDAGNLWGEPPLASLALMGLHLTLHAVRRRFLHRAARTAADDEAAAATHWRSAFTDPAARTALTRLAAQAAAWAHRFPSGSGVGCGVLRQLNRVRVSGLSRRGAPDYFNVVVPQAVNWASLPRPQSPAAGAGGCGWGNGVGSEQPWSNVSTDLGTNGSGGEVGRGRRQSLTQVADSDEAFDNNTNTLPGVPDPRRPVASLDQLFSQAAGCAPLLARNAAAWAACTRGTIYRPPAMVDPAQVPAPAPKSAGGNAEAKNTLAGQVLKQQGPPASGARVAAWSFWANLTQKQGPPWIPASPQLEDVLPPSWQTNVRDGVLKGPRRAAEKAAGCYGGDISRLLDVCRARIIFNHPDDLAACLDLVCEKAEATTAEGQCLSGAVRVLRVRCMHNAGGVAACSENVIAGVVVALRFDSDQTRLLGVENHICELQLLLSYLLPNLNSPEMLERYHLQRFARAFQPQYPATSGIQHRSASGVVIQNRFPQIWPRKDKKMASYLKGGANSTEDPDVPMLSVPIEGESFEPKLSLQVEIHRASSAADSLPVRCTKINLDLCERDRLAVRVLRRAALNPSKVLDRLASRPDFALETSNPGANWFSSMPLEAAATNVFFRVVWLIMSAFLAYRGVVTFTSAQRNGIFLCSGRARFRPLEARGVGSRGHIDDFGLLLDGCEVNKPKIMEKNISDGVVVLEYGSAVRANGYFFTTSTKGEPSADPKRWIVEVLACSEPEGANFLASGAGNGSVTVSLPASRDAENESHGVRCEWMAVGASVWRIRAAGIDLFPLLTYSTPATPRGARITADHRISWPKALDLSYATGDWSLALLCCAAGGWAGQPQLVPVFMGAVAGLDVALATASSIGFQLAQDWRNVVQGWLSIIARLILLFGIVWFQHRIVWVLLLTAVSSYAVFLVPTVFFYSVPALKALGTISELRPTVFLLAIIIGFRNRAFRRARQLLESDNRRYAAAWAFELARPGAKDWIHALACLSSELSSRCPRRAYQQLSAPGPAEQAHGNGVCRGGWVGTIKTLERVWWRAQNIVGGFQDRGRSERLKLNKNIQVRSLDQLFVQALCCHPLLVRKVCTWALISRGAFPAGRDPEDSASETLFRTLKGEELDQPCDAVIDSKMQLCLESLSQSSTTEDSTCIRHQTDSNIYSENTCQSSPTIRASLASTSTVLPRKANAVGIRFAAIKSTSRSVEKAVRCYKKDVSLLVDLCRQSITFSDGDDLVTCLRAIRDDRDTVVVRVKNRMDPAHSGGAASYRDVLVNLCIVTAEAKDIGVEGHVCEVQLLLKSFAGIKREDGHKRYVTFRNLRGE